MSTYQDFRLEFNKHPVKKDILLVHDRDAIIQSIRNLILMNHYESPFQPELGCNIRKQLFEPLSDFSAQDISRWIKETLENFERRVKITALYVVPNSNEDGYDIRIEFFIDTSTEPITIDFILERIR